MLKKILQNLWVKCSYVVVATGLSDYVWARYIHTVADSQRFEASIWSAIVVVLGAVVITSYVDDRRLILPAGIGAFIGTYLAI